jgi:mannose-6-phosphate isomerase-like protein (cupin superfamily)
MTHLDIANYQHPQVPPPRPAITGPGEGEAYWFYGDLAVMRSPQGARPVIIEHRLPPGAAAPLHFHRELEDSFYLVAGRLAVRCGDETFVASPGDYVSLPAEVPHTLRVVSDEEAVMLQTHSGETFLEFIRRVGVPAAQARPNLSTLDFGAMNDVAAQTGHPVLGPPMSAEEAAAIVQAQGA